MQLSERNKKQQFATVLTHLGVWAVALSLPYLLDTHHGIPQNHDANCRPERFKTLNFLTNLLWVVPFYLNVYLLIPRFFYTRRYLRYSLLLLLMFAAVLAMHSALFISFFSVERFSLRGATNFLLPPFTLTIAVGIAVRIVADRVRADREAQEKQQETLKTELSFLRSQINPHFIFNVLNNLAALEQMQSPELRPTIFKLSTLMQYMLYETDEEKVDLAREAEYLQSYIDLQRQRFGQKVNIDVCLDTGNKYQEIEPMLLIPFVENAFKHGIGLIERPAIIVRMQVNGSILSFTVSNKFSETREEKDKSSGIGLGNVKRRLELLYGPRHTLSISSKENWFTVSLTINLH